MKLSEIKRLHAESAKLGEGADPNKFFLDDYEKQHRVEEINTILRPYTKIHFIYFKEAIKTYFKTKYNKEIKLNFDMNSKREVDMFSSLAELFLTLDEKKYSLGWYFIGGFYEEERTFMTRGLYDAAEYCGLKKDYPDIVDAFYEATAYAVNTSKTKKISLIKQCIEERNAKISAMKDTQNNQSKIEELEKENKKDLESISSIEENMIEL